MGHLREEHRLHEPLARGSSQVENPIQPLEKGLVGALGGIDRHDESVALTSS